MANRPIYIPSVNTESLLEIKEVDFKWFPGLSISQKQKSINSLHSAAKEQLGLKNILEISSKSESPLGVELSAFNLQLASQNNIKASVEVFFQGSKVFSEGGPFTDLYLKTSREAKKDSRLKESGNLVEFNFEGKSWPLIPNTLFYSWLYINALDQNKPLANDLLQYDAFTDIEFNPNKSINCQAASAATYKSLVTKSLIKEVMESSEKFTDIFKQSSTNQVMTQNTLF
tara:strand:+ start:159 stop:845 length:687 start_codon:yes stop_codon:yes gene_type:complete